METIAEENAVLLAQNVDEMSDAHESSYVEETSVEISTIEENQTFENSNIIAESDGTNLENSFSNQLTDCSSNIEEGNIEEVLENKVIEETCVVEPSVTEGNQESENPAEGVENADNIKKEQNQNISEDIVLEDVEMLKNEPPQQQKVQEQSTEVEGSDYNSEYMLEHHTENVYMPENIIEDNVVPTGQVYSTEIISDDSQEVIYDKELEASKPSETEQVPQEDDNFVSEYVTEQNTEMHSEEQVNDVEINDESQNLKDEYVNLNADATKSNENYKDDSGELENQVTVMEESNEIELSDPLQINNDVNEVIRKETDNADKEEMALGNSSEKDNEHVSDFNNEVVQNIELQNDSTVSSQTTMVSDFTISEDIEVGQIEDGEYTIVEGPTSLNMTATHHASESNSEETVLLLQNYDNAEAGTEIVFESEEQQEVYLTEVSNEPETQDFQSSSTQTTETRPSRRGRKPTYEIPMHVLGHDINKPVESVVNGRPAPRPRLGVKVPYRNLTSQIVTKAEIEKEIMERVRLKQEQVFKGDVLFARKLTQRLARKIAPSPDPPRRNTAVAKAGASSAQPQRKNVEVEEVTISKETQPLKQPEVAQENTKIQNDSDLIAILEGEGEEMPVLPKEISQSHDDESNLKMLEREIALQQLSDLPNQAPKQRIYNRGRHYKAPTLMAEVSSNKDSSPDTSTSQSSAAVLQKASQQSPNKENSSAKETVHVSSRKEQSPKENISSKKNHNSKETAYVSSKKDQINLDVSSPTKKQQLVEIEPQVKVNMVLKTYSRKRNFTEAPSNSPPPKKAFLDDVEVKIEKSDQTSTSDVYVTKSSRVIKKKVIWDPDEVPSRSPKPSTKSDFQSPVKAVPVKTAKSTEKTAVNSERVSEKKPATEKSAQEKIVDKKAPEKATPRKIIKEKTATSSEKKTSKNKTPVKVKKGRSEVDKLLMDEGAVKMLYDLKNADETVVRKKKDVYSVDRAHKELMKKANELKNDFLEQNTSNESPKSLRKKEGFSPSPSKLLQISGITERKMSKDSTRSSVHTPPGSPAYSFPHSQSSMLVRRRSSSSISSSDEIEDSDSVKLSKKKLATSSSDVPKAKKAKKSDNSKEVKEQAISKNESPSKVAKAADQKLQYKTFTVKKSHKHINIDLNYSDKKCYCTVQVLEELTAALNKFAKEKDCLVVSITSGGKAFCLGLDYVSLVSEKEEVRKKNATELAKHVRDFLVCLLHFPKVLLAAIQGECIGLGVTMLPLFDMVIASDTATFSTPYANLGCVAEAGFLLTLPNLINHGLAAELLYTTQKLTADDAFRRGLISRLCWPEKYNETFKNFLSSISKSSKQSLEATKKQLRSPIVQKTEAAINSETKILIEHWTSPECQKNFARLESGI